MEDRRKLVLRIINETPWGDIEGALSVIDEGLAIAMRASRDEFMTWEQHHDAVGFTDEFSIDDVSRLSPEWRFALVARLLRSIAMAYGVGTDYAWDGIGQLDPHISNASIQLRKLLEATAPLGWSVRR